MDTRYRLRQTLPAARNDTMARTEDTRDRAGQRKFAKSKHLLW